MPLIELIRPVGTSLVLTGEKDEKSSFISISKECEEFFQLPQSEIIGRRDEELPIAASEFANFFYEQDKLAQSNKQSVLCFDVHFYDGLQAIFFSKNQKLLMAVVEV